MNWRAIIYLGFACDVVELLLLVLTGKKIYLYIFTLDILSFIVMSRIFTMMMSKDILEGMVGNFLAKIMFTIFSPKE